MLATYRYQRVQAAQQKAVRERMDALERLAESERRRAGAERLALVGQLAAGVAHEVNNPLAYVTSSVRYLKQQTTARSPLLEDDQDAFDQALEGLVRIQQIVRDLSTFARGGTDDLSSSCSLRAAVLEAVRVASLRFAKGVHVEHDIPEACPEVAISRGRLVQVLVNLLVNAAEAVESGAAARGGAVLVRAQWPTPTRVQLLVEDSGPGIAEAVLPRLFEPFVTTKGSKGTGLGLAMCREYLHAAGAQISVLNAPEGGARFTVDLPAVATPGAPGPA